MKRNGIKISMLHYIYIYIYICGVKKEEIEDYKIFKRSFVIEWEYNLK